MTDPESRYPCLSPHADGIVLTIRAQPGARREGIVGLHGTALKIAVAAPPDKGRANAALLAVVAKAFAVAAARVTVLGGVHSRDKRMLIRGFTLTEASAILAACLSGK